MKVVKPQEWCGGAGAGAAWRVDFIASCMEVGAAERVDREMLLATITGVTTKGVVALP